MSNAHSRGCSITWCITWTPSMAGPPLSPDAPAVAKLNVERCALCSAHWLRFTESPEYRRTEVGYPERSRTALADFVRRFAAEGA